MDHGATDSVLVTLNKWASRQVDFVLAYPQADIECPLYMEIPRGFQSEGSRKKNCLLLEKNIYGQRQAGRVWNQYLHDGLIARGFKQSKIDMCLYYRGNVALLFYVDDGIFIGPTQKDIDKAYNSLSRPVLSSTGEILHRAFVMTDEGDLSDYLGVKIDKLPNGTIKVTQPHLIQSVLDDLKFNERTGTKKTPAVPTVKLHRDLHGEPMDEEWQYRSVIGKLNFIEKSTRPDIAYAVHQCARFSADPKQSHASAVKRIGKYLLATKDKGMILNPKNHSFDCWVDADFVGNWDRVNADVDPGTAKSRAGYIITYGACPIVWASKMLQEVALSTTEAEYCAISMSLRDVIFLMQLLEETAVELPWETSKERPKVHCKLFEDNSGALEMARLPKMRPRTKHLCVKMHHFREYVRKGKVSVHKIPTRFQLGDIATKAQPEPLFVSQRESLLQWDAETMTTEELALPAKHLRACDISDKSEDLCMDQHANAFSVKVPERVVEVIGPGIKPGIGKGPSEARVIRAGRAKSASDSLDSRKGNGPKYPKRQQSPPLRTGKALRDWIRDKGFNGVSTTVQRERSKGKKAVDGVSLEGRTRPKGHWKNKVAQEGDI